jgi:hypothetical protein
MRNLKNIFFIKTILLGCCFLLLENAFAQNHPSLILTVNDVREIRSHLGKAPLFDTSLAAVKLEVDAAIMLGIQVPVPHDMAGGFSHEKHKQNFLILQQSGILYQILQDDKYAIYVRDVLLAYAKMYPTLGLHPQQRSYAPGKLFWQALNDANWLVYVSQAYDCVYDFLTKKERDQMEQDLFKPFADFLSVGSPQFFNRVHNHSTWGNVAVGMIGLVMNDDKLVNRALFGLKDDTIKPGQKDNDGGFIKKFGQKTGFFANVEEPFSPDGYYTEGPYYLRYAMYPFLIFAEALENKKPDLKIWEYKNRVLLQSVYALLNLTNSEGKFFPLNDSQKGMSIYSRELVSAVDIAYTYGGKDNSLLSIAQKQGRVSLDNSGMDVALAIHNNLETPFLKKSIQLSDGSDGKQGGVAILRNQNKDNELTLVMKYSAQGLSHGHYDKLSFSLYNKGIEVIQDYGSSRFVNIEQKKGGGYLKENDSWAKQSIAHNTIVQNERSHFNGDFETGSQFHSENYLFDVSNPKVQITSAIENNAYPGTSIHRTMVLIDEENYENPLVLDIIQLNSNSDYQYDLPFYYLGQLMSTNFTYETPKILEPLGKSNGYQHLWKEGIGTAIADNTKISWLNEGHFYSLTSATQKTDELLFVRIGAHDPNFNLRRDPGFIIRKMNSQKASFVSAIETHGSYNVVSESAVNSYSSIAHLEVVYEDANYIAITIKNKDQSTIVFVLATHSNLATQEHQLQINEKNYQWVGPYYYTKIK